MPLYAVLDGGAIVAHREITDWNSYPEHKKLARDEKGDGGPTLRPIVEEGSGEVVNEVIDLTQVRKVRSERPLDAIKATLKARLGNDAEQVRLKYVTPGAAMALTYQEKKDQAVAVLDLGEEAANALSQNEQASQFPVLAASVGIEAETLFAVAELVFDKYEQFAALAYVIERTRLSGKAAIDAADNPSGARLAYEGVSWAV